MLRNTILDNAAIALGLAFVLASVNFIGLVSIPAWIPQSLFLIWACLFSLSFSLGSRSLSTGETP